MWFDPIALFQFRDIGIDEKQLLKNFIKKNYKHIKSVFIQISQIVITFLDTINLT